MFLYLGQNHSFMSRFHSRKLFFFSREPNRKSQELSIYPCKMVKNIMFPYTLRPVSASLQSGPEVIKKFHAQLMHEIFPAHKC